jgi:tetratricopeptide (TPR) repeat protein
MTKYFIAIASITTLLLSGCASVSVPPQDTAAGTNKEAPVKAREFEPETLYNLLVAEIAGQRKRFDIALGNYLKEAHKTHDAGVAQRATQIAQFIMADQAALDASLLWHQLEPSNVIAQQSAALQLLKAKRFEEAFTYIEDLLQVNAPAPFDVLIQIYIRLSAEDKSSMEPLLQHLLANHPDNAQVLLTIASTRTPEQFDAALELTSQAIDIDETYTAAILLKAKLLHLHKESPQAIELLLDKISDFNDINEQKSLMTLLARFYWDTKDIALANKYYKTLSNSFPTDGSIRLLYALTTREVGKKEAAYTLLSTLANRPAFADSAHYYLGYFCEEDKQLDTALAHYQQVTAGRDLWIAQTRIAKILIKQKHYQQALDSINKIDEKQRSKHEQFALLSSEALMNLNKLSQAFDVVNNALDPESPSINLMYARAMIAEQMDDVAQMEADFKHIISIQPLNASALNALGYTLANKTDRSEEALSLLTRANKIAPDDPAIIDSLGWVYYRMGNIDKSLQLLKQAYNAYPDHEVAAHLGEVLWVQGFHEQARSIWQEGLSDEPESKIVLETIERLTGKDTP